MRYASEHKQRTRRRVLVEAAAAIRAQGPSGVSVATLMAKAGLTHGGFYAHFKSKDDLVAQAVSHMFEESSARFPADVDEPNSAVALGNYIDMYLSKGHRDAPEHGCPMPALSGEIARMPKSARKRFTAGYEGMTRFFAKHLREIGKPAPERLAASMIAEIVGAVALARAIEDRTASDRILKTSRDALKARIGT